MIEIDNTLVSDDLYHIKFACDCSQCKGQCCIEGDAGAPLEEEEEKLLEQHYKAYKPYMTERGIRTIEKNGHMKTDQDGELVTHLVNGKECAYAYKEEGAWKCAIEKAFLAGEINFRKPISCYLYPVRLKIFKDKTIAVNYQKWNICKSALINGEQQGIRLYEFLKDPLITRFGNEWYKILCDAVKLI